MIQYLVAYLATAVVFLGIDFVWLSQMDTRLYRDTLGDIMLPGFNVAPALLFYVLFIVGVVFFCVAPAFASGRWATATVNGALFGFFSYATYDLTNQATLRNWTSTISIADMAWGAVLTAVAATAGYLVTTAMVDVAGGRGG